ADDQSFLRLGITDQIHNGLVAPERSTTPILRDVAEHPVLDLVPLAGAWWEVTDMKLQSGLISQSLQFDLPQSRAVAVTAAAIGRDEQLRRLWESARAHFAPPLQDAGDSELGRVVVDPHAHPAFIGGDVVDTVRIRNLLTVALGLFGARFGW